MVYTYNNTYMVWLYHLLCQFVTLTSYLPALCLSFFFYF